MSLFSLTNRQPVAVRISRGFTLIELMVVVAIVAILASFGLPAYQDYTRKAYVAELITLAGPMQKQIADNVLNGVPLDSGVRFPTSKYGTYTMNITTGLVSIATNPTYFDNVAYRLDMGLRTTDPATGLPVTVDPPIIPNGNLWWVCRSAAQGVNVTYPYLPVKWVPETCKSKSIN